MNDFKLHEHHMSGYEVFHQRVLVGTVHRGERRALFLPLYFSVQIRKFCSWNELVLINELNYLVPYDIHIVILFI